MRQELQSKVAEGQRVSEECQNVMKGGRDEARVFVYIGEREGGSLWGHILLLLSSLPCRYRLVVNVCLIVWLNSCSSQCNNL